MNPQTIQQLLELRKRLILCVAGFLIIFVALFPFSNQIYQLLAVPASKYLPSTTHLVALEVTAPFFVPLKLTALVAFMFNLPNLVYQIWQFIAPGLYKPERKLLISVIISSFTLFILGITFCYCVVLPALFHFISNFIAPQITLLTDIDKYLSLVLSLFMIFGIAFETPVLVFLLIRFGILSLEKAAKIRKYIFVGCFIVAAIVTPPDVLSQTMLAIPLYLLYELGLLAAKILQRPAKQNV
jgi:sec-independent protein translocase protein TatC